MGSHALYDCIFTCMLELIMEWNIWRGGVILVWHQCNFFVLCVCLDCTFLTSVLIPYVFFFFIGKLRTHPMGLKCSPSYYYWSRKCQLRCSSMTFYISSFSKLFLSCLLFDTCVLGWNPLSLFLNWFFLY